jgi:hypothetical protein
LLAFDLNAMAIEGGTPTEKIQTTLDSDSLLAVYARVVAIVAVFGCLYLPCFVTSLQNIYVQCV